jgi:hypothetical protein
MMERLKGTLKNELEALKNGKPIEEGTPNKGAATGPPKSSGRKRKTRDADNDGEVDPTATKRGRSRKNATPEVENEPMVKNERDDDVNFAVEDEAEV